MLCFKVQKTQDNIQQIEANKKIDLEIKHTSQLYHKKSHIRLLLLGTGDAGKSTFAKQMAICYLDSSITDTYFKSFISTIRENCLIGMKQLIELLLENGTTLPASLEPNYKQILETDDLSLVTAANIKKLWESQQFQALISAVDIDGLKYFFSQAARFAEATFVPGIADVLHARRKTTGIIETKFEINNTVFTLVDVGGQRSERRKWVHCFKDVTAVIFLAAINEYDMILEEDGETNRLVESLKLWKALTGSQFFKTTPFILFLNKSDLFSEKIKTVPLGKVFVDYPGFSQRTDLSHLDEFTKAWKYVAMQYQAHFSGKTFFPHVTCAIDTNASRKVFDSVKEILLKEITSPNNSIEGGL